MKWPLIIAGLIVFVSALVGAASFTGYGLPTGQETVSVRLESLASRTHRGGTRYFGK